MPIVSLSALYICIPCLIKDSALAGFGKVLNFNF